MPKNPSLFPGGVEIKHKDGSTITAGTVWEAFSDSLEKYTLDYVSEVTEVPAEKIEEAVRIYTTRLNPLHGNGGIHYQLAPDQTGHAVQNSRALQLIACITGNSDEPAGNRGSSKAQVDGCCGRANMLVTDNGEQSHTWGVDVGTMHLGDTPRNLSIEQQIPLIQEFVQYLIDEKSPLAERTATTSPPTKARWIAERKGGNYKPHTAWPPVKTPFQSNEKQISAGPRCCAIGTSRWATRTIWDSINEIDTRTKSGGVCMSSDFMNGSPAWRGLGGAHVS